VTKGNKLMAPPQKGNINDQMSKLPRRFGGGSIASSMGMKARPCLLRSQTKSADAPHGPLRRSQNVLGPLRSPRLTNGTSKTSDSDSDLSDDISPSALSLPWLDRISALQAELDAVWREEQLIDLSVYSTFDQASQSIPPTDDVVSATRGLMDASFEAFQAKLERKKELQLREAELLEELRSERAKHSANIEFTADSDPRFDPELDLDCDSDRPRECDRR
jgi:hypothetical protein